MKVGDLVRYIPYGRHEPTENIGIIVYIDKSGYYEVRWCDVGPMSVLVSAELEALCKSEI